MATYLQVEYSTGKIFEYSKDEKEGFVEHTNTKNVTSYRRFLDKGLYGTITKVEKRDSNFGDQISVTVVDTSGNTNYLSIPLFDGKRNISTFAEGFITNLKGLELNKPYRIYPYSIENEGKSYKTTGVSIKHANLSDMTVSDSVEKYTQSYMKDGEEVKGDIPKIEWKEKMGTSTPDKDAKNEFLYNIFDSYVKSSTNEQPKQKAKATPKPQQEEELDEDLPF